MLLGGNRVTGARNGGGSTSDALLKTARRVAVGAIVALLVGGCGGASSEKPDRDDAWYNSTMMRPVFGDFDRTEAREVVDPQQEAALYERGEYLVRGAAACGSCHASRAGDPSAPLTGGRLMRDRFGTLAAANITPDRETGIGDWSVGEIMRATRASIDRHGRPLSIDLHATFRWLSDRDARAIATFLLASPPVRSEVERRRLGGVERNRWGLISQHKDLEGYVPAPSEGNRIQYGRYLAQHVGGCFGCHTAEAGLVENAPPFGGVEASKGSLFGSLFSLFRSESADSRRKSTATELSGVVSPRTRDDLARAANLDRNAFDRRVGAIGEDPAHDEALSSGEFPFGGPDIRGTSEDGILTWSQADIVSYLDTGSTPTGERSDGRICPWPFFRHMTARDKEAIARFLKTQ